MIVKKNIWLSLLTLCIVGVTAVAALRGQANISSKQKEQDKANQLPDPNQFPITDATELDPLEPKEIAKRKAKSKKYSQYNSDIGPGVARAVMHYHWPPGFPELPFAQSDAVIIGEVSKAVAHLTEDKTSVYSEFTIRIDEIFKDDSQTSLAVDSSIIVDRLGGRVRYPEGKISWFSISGWGMPREGRQYVLFLKRNGQDEDYQIVTGYELRHGRVYPLDKGSNLTKFDIYTDAEETSFLNKLRGIAKTSQRAKIDDVKGAKVGRWAWDVFLVAGQ